MASIIRIKRSGVTGSPPSLAQGEIAYSYLAGEQNNGGDRLYIGTGTEVTPGVATNIEVIGGKYFTTKLDHAPGTLTANSAIIVDSNSKINEIKIDDIVIDSNTISTAVANTNLVLIAGGGKSIDVSGFKITNLGAPSANTDAVTKAYVDNAISGLESNTDFSYAADIGSGQINIVSDTFSILGGTGLTTSANSATDSIVITLDNTTVVANTYDASTGIPTFTVDAQGRLTAASTSTTLQNMSSIDVGDLSIANNTITNTTGSIVLNSSTDVIDVSGAVISNVGTPVANNDVTTKAYVDSAVSSLESASNLDIAGDSGTGSILLASEVLTLAGGTGLSTSVSNNAITVTLDNTGVAANTYGSSTEIPILTINAQGQVTLANTASISTDLAISGDSGSDTVSLLTDTFNIAGGTGLSTAVANNSVTVNLDNTGVAADTYGSTTEIPVLTINAQGQVTLANTVSISTDLSITGDTGTDTVSLLTDSLNFNGGTGVTTTVSNNSIEFAIGQDVATTANVIFNSVDATFSLETGNIIISGNTISTVSANTELVLDPGTFISVNDNLIKDVADPESPGDAANKRYVDTVAQGLSILPSAKAATTTDLGATYAAGPNGLNPGVGATLTIPAVATLNIDGVTSWTLGDNILVKDQTNLFENGSYTITQVGGAVTNWILTRATFDDEPDEIPGSFEFVSLGTQYKSTGWVATTPSANNGIVVGTDDIVWVQFSGAGTYIAGNGLDLQGNIFSVNVDGSSIEIVADTLQVANNGITNAMLAGSIENSKLVNSSISFSANTGTTDAVSLGETITIAGNTGVTTTISNNEIMISGTLATDIAVGVAKFSNTDFLVTDGLVTIVDESIQDVVANFIVGGQSITSTYDDANNVLTIASTIATTTTIGVASFGGWTDSSNTVRQFAVTGGDVRIVALDGGTY